MADDKTTNEEIFDGVIRHQIYLDRYRANLFKHVLPIISATQEDILGRISRLKPTSNPARLESVLGRVSELNDEMSKEMQGLMSGELSSLAASEVLFHKSIVENAIPEIVNISFELPKKSVLLDIVTREPFHGRFLKEWTKSVGKAATVRARQQLYIGMVEGESIQRISKRFRDVVEIGVRRDADAIVRTAVNHVSNAAKQSLYEANSDVIEGVRWTATLDGRTSDVCRGRDGMMFPVNKGPRPPAHPNCRSTIVPVIKSLKDLGLEGDFPIGTRASMNGQVPSDITYGKWLKTQTTEFQNDVLGPTRAKLFRKGELTLDKFVDTTGKTLTLKELAAKYKIEIPS